MQINDRVLQDDGERQTLSLTITASAEEVDACADIFFGQIAQKDIPGFRRGKAPRNILEQSVGGHGPAMGGVAETLINELAFKAIDDEDVIFISDPQFNVESVVEANTPMTFTAKGAVAPRMTLASDGPVSIEMPPDEATESEIESQISELQNHYHSFEKIEDASHCAAMGDYVEIIVTVTNHDKPVSGLGHASRMIGLGAGTMPASFDEHVIGAKAGDTLEFDFEAKDEEGGSALGDGELHAVVEVKGFRTRILPEVDDAFALKVGCADVADLHKQLAYAINVQKSKDLPKLMVDRAVFELVGRLQGDVPAYYTDFIRQDVGRELMQSLEQQGTDLQQWMLENSINSEQMKEDVAQEAARRAAIDCALEALFVSKGWEVTDEDIDKMFEGEDGSEDTRASWEQANRMADLRKMCRQSKVTRWLLDTADVTVVDDTAA